MQRSERRPVRLWRESLRRRNPHLLGISHSVRDDKVGNMTILTELALFVAGFFFLIKGADVLVDGASSIAKRFGLSTFFIGLTIVAFGTSAPELVVSVLASVQGSAGIALGNIVGSNISNTLLILGISAIVAPLLVKRDTIRKEIPFSILAAVALLVLVNDKVIDNSNINILSRIDGLVLILFFIIFIVYTFGLSREKETVIEKAVEDIKDVVEDIKEEQNELSMRLSVLMIFGGLAGLLLGGKWIVDGGVLFATHFGISETLIGLTLVAIGTSLPELAASAVAAYKGRTDMAVGGVVGSNVFNLLWVLGVGSVIRPIPFDAVLNADFAILLSVTILLILLIYIGKKNILARREGVMLVFLYVLYIIYLIIRG